MGRVLHLRGRERGVVAAGRVATPINYAAAYNTPIPRCIERLAGTASASLWWPAPAVPLQLRGSWLDHLTAVLQQTEAKQENSSRYSRIGMNVASACQGKV